MKRHFEILDGLRGTAAILVVIFHLMEAVYPDPALNPLHHAYLAVDFFFLLSGYVVGYAYDDRWPAMTVRQFLRIRLIRLHPLVLLGVLIGALGYWFDPFVGTDQAVSPLRLILGLAAGLFLLPTPALPNRWGETHSLNGPCWSLLQEYIANIIYAIIGPRISRIALIWLVVIAGIALAVTAVWNGHLQGGWGDTTFWMAPVRMVFPFFAGLLLYRLKVRIRVPMAYPLLSLLLLALFALPYFPLNGVYEAICVIVFFPFIVAAGAGAHISGSFKRLCSFSGRISYPIYILHYPFIYIYTHWYYAKHPSVNMCIIVGLAAIVFFVALSWVALVWYDEPVRAWLNKRFKKTGRAGS